ncbi:ImmA/IrrE family metallo-endopeptidase [Pseudomonas sp. GX19020]|uniref:ImmA/IrrE family metallo-endopeptidase n=1 Tax=Pseudomonas sp. GX19020 TaxID=2942277 RepID=UPI00201902AF|nr:ImmA/IrrE family metallo-endopeptidase [Pseudomonas sp. GX19020]MCL4069321.1 ImmA/IrrE family metallo-endopeptidase [Pseudomonas sp. GX19020]
MRPTPPGYQSKLPKMLSSALDTAERVLEYCKNHDLLTDYDAANIEDLIARDEALSLVYVDLQDKDAYIKCNSDEDFEIGINKRHHRNRQRFSMAHEYGHYQLHRSDIKRMAVGERILHRDGEINPVERQANNFAANLLMPEASVRKALKAASNDVATAAKLLQVSIAALDFRLANLGLNNGK